MKFRTGQEDYDGTDPESKIYVLRNHKNMRGQSEKTSDMFGDVLNNNSVNNSINKIVDLLENKV